MPRPRKSVQNAAPVDQAIAGQDYILEVDWSEALAEVDGAITHTNVDVVTGKAEIIGTDYKDGKSIVILNAPNAGPLTLRVRGFNPHGDQDYSRKVTVDVAPSLEPAPVIEQSVNQD